jgi:hypothetical protein
MVDGSSVERLREYIEEVEPPKQEQRMLLQAWISPVVWEGVRRVAFEMKIDKRAFIEGALSKACVEYFEQATKEEDEPPEEGP